MATAAAVRPNGKANTNVAEPSAELLRRLGFASAFVGDDGKQYVFGYKSGRVAVAEYGGKLVALVLDAYDRADRVYPASMIENARIEITDSLRVRLTVGNASALFDNARAVASWLNRKLARRIPIRLRGSVTLDTTIERELVTYAAKQA
jgi:hypothetical protein